MKPLYNGMLSPALHDYVDPVRYPGPPPHVVRLRLLNAGTADVEAYIREHAVEIEEFSKSSERYVEV